MEARDARSRLPPEVEASVSVGEGFEDLVIGDREWESGSGVQWATPGWYEASDRYLIEVYGGTRDLSLLWAE